MSFPPSPLHFQAWTQVLTSLLNAKRLNAWVCEHACTCVIMCIFYAINIWRGQATLSNSPSVFLLTSSFSMSSWSPFSSGLISLCIFSHHSGGHRTHSAALIPLGLTSTSALGTSPSAFPSPSHFLFGDEFLWGATFIKIATFRAWSPEDSYLPFFLDYWIPSLCHVAQDDLAAWIERMKKSYGKEDSKTRYANILIAILLHVEL